MSPGIELFKFFVNFNIRVSEAIEPAHWSEIHAYTVFRRKCIELMASQNISRVLDVGAGKKWHFPAYLKEELCLQIIGIDISLEEMRENLVLDEKIECDVCKDITLREGSVDLVTARAGVEHFDNNAAFVINCARCLRPGGYMVATFANKYAPFALLNQALPSNISRWLLKNLIPGSEGVLGFQAHYDKCSYSGFSDLLSRSGLNVVYYYPSFFSSGYFKFFLPLFLLSLGLDMIRFALSCKNLSSYHLFVAQKPYREDVDCEKHVN